MDELTMEIRKQLEDIMVKEKQFIRETAKWIADQAGKFEDKANKIIDDVIKTCEIVPKETILDILQNHGSVFVNEYSVPYDNCHLRIEVGGYVLSSDAKLDKGKYSFIVIVKKVKDRVK